MRTFFIFCIAVLLIVVGYGMVLPALTGVPNPEPAVTVEAGDVVSRTTGDTTCDFYAQAIDCHPKP